MVWSREQIAEMERAYELLAVPASASVFQIKQAYRKLTKRWHPDLYKPGSAEQADATRMMGLFIDAYKKIATAPLRYFDPRVRQVEESGERGPYVERASMPLIYHLYRYRPDEPPPKVHVMEYCVRFFFGALLGLGLSFRALTRLSNPDVSWGVGAAIAVAFVGVFGGAAAVWGDDFWLGFFRGSWWR